MSAERPTVRETASVIVTETVDGTRRRKSGVRRKLVAASHHLVVDPRVMAAARAAMHPGQRLVIVSATAVRLVNA